MRIVVRDIPASGRQVGFALDDAWAADAAAQVVEGDLGVLDGEIRLTRRKPEGATVEASGRLTATLPCYRCGRETELVLDAHEQLLYRPLADDGSTGEVQLEAADLEVGWYEGESLALDQVVSELFTLALPARVLCADASTCVLPEMEAGEADESVGHPAFAKLGELF